MMIAVVAIQGDVSEHADAFRKSLKKLQMKGSVTLARSCDDLKGADAVAVPGGESTTISRLMEKAGMDRIIIRMAEEGKPVMGTCAGAILLAKKGGEQVRQTGQKLLGLMDMEVDRNAYGRQIDSFETDIDIPALGGRKFRGVFIRAPLIRRVFGEANVFARCGGQIAGAIQGKMLALTFHPELTDDFRIHEFFLGMVLDKTNKHK
jgi:5'-phosphate synthase pdxT subunit